MYSPTLAPIKRPTSVEPVKPTLLMVPSSRPLTMPSKVSLPSATTVIKTSFGTPAAWKIAVIASATAGVYSDGFQTTEFPVSNAGMMYQDGTAAGKFPAVIISAVPTGMRNVNKFLFGISLGTVCPYRRRPSPKKKSQVSITS